MKEVFCGDCTHFAQGYSDREYEHCAKAKVKEIARKNHCRCWTERTAETPAAKNANNDCKDFKWGGEK